MSVCESKLATRPIPYCAGSVGQELVGRDDLWAKPLEVRWLCRKHHAQRHRELEGAI